MITTTGTAYCKNWSNAVSLIPSTILILFTYESKRLLYSDIFILTCLMFFSWLHKISFVPCLLLFGLFYISILFLYFDFCFFNSSMFPYRLSCLYILSSVYVNFVYLSPGFYVCYFVCYIKFCVPLLVTLDLSVLSPPPNYPPVYRD